MALTLTLGIGTACAGGNHFTITGTPAGAYSPRTAPCSTQELLLPITQDEIEVFMRLLIRLYYKQCLDLGKTPGQTKTAIQNKVLDLTIP